MTYKNRGYNVRANSTTHNNKATPASTSPPALCDQDTHEQHRLHCFRLLCPLENEDVTVGILWGNLPSLSSIRNGDADGVAVGQQKIDRLMDIYSVGSVFVPVIKEGARLRGIVDSNICTFPIVPPTEAETLAIISILAKERIETNSQKCQPVS